MKQRSTALRATVSTSTYTGCDGQSVGGPEAHVWKKDSKSQYDPQVGAAAQANAALAERTQQWTEDFYAKNIEPLIDQMIAESKTNVDRQGALFDLNMDQATLQDERYRKLGIPAEDRYYKMVNDYSSTEEQEKQARSAIGDQRTAAATRDAQLKRKFAGIGVDPSSPAAMSAMADFAVNDAAMEAAAATKAREAAKTLGMGLISDAANFGRGGASGVLQFGAAAGGNASAATAGTQSAIGAAAGGSSPTLNAAGIAQRSYTANLDAYAGLRKAEMEQQAASSAGFGQLLGVVGSAAIGKWSDRRLKKDVKLVTRMSNGLRLYEYRYIWDAPDAAPHIGYMADEVRALYPQAVFKDESGYDKIDYDKVPFS